MQLFLSARINSCKKHGRGDYQTVVEAVGYVPEIRAVPYADYQIYNKCSKRRREYFSELSADFAPRPFAELAERL